jgi:glycerol-3-phosphate acyltransferase PlsX
MGKMLKEEFHTNLKTKICGLLLKKNLKHFKSRLDSKAVGGAMIIGAKAPIVKAHGSSDAETFKNAIKQARLMVLYKVIDKVKENLPKEEA